MNRRSFLYQAGWLGIACCGCRSVPMTDRKQLVLMPEDQESKLGLTAFEEVTAKQPVSTNAHYAEIVNRVGKRLADVADRSDYKWEYKVLASAEQNAFCLPGGKVAIYEGIMPICATEAGVAVVMSHEIAHALARHGGERMSHQYAVEGVKKAVTFFTRNSEEKTKEMVLQAYGVGTQYGVVLPYSRKHESEADHMGLLLMAKAGYDPREAPLFWNRFAAASPKDKPAEFMSTHPSDERRSADLQALIPEASKLYAAAPGKFGQGVQLAIAPLPGQAPAGPTPAPTQFHPGLQPGQHPAMPAGYSGAPGQPPAGWPNWLPPMNGFQRGA